MRPPPANFNRQRMKCIGLTGVLRQLPASSLIPIKVNGAERPRVHASEEMSDEEIRGDGCRIGGARNRRLQDESDSRHLH